jgi:DNA-binding NarL/FixJ family response regulator/tRNA A-37 threonylcarbamoyl transferase component Bud32
LLEVEMAAESGLIAGRFQMGPVIGAGATGNVFAGTDRLTGEKVAIKQLRSDLVLYQPEMVERFRREGEALRRLNHPNIVKVLATMEDEGQHYIVMEYVGGGSLEDLLIKQPRLPVERVVAIGLELADALSRAHHLEILHRDIKPGNILLAEDGTPRLTDFGLARFGQLSSLTEYGSILGTFLYLSPEAVENRELDERSDLWSFGVVLYEMLTGRLPFEGDSPFDVAWAIRSQPLPPIENYRSEIPAPLADLVRRMLRKDSSARPSSARLVGAELEAIQKSLKKGRSHSEPAASDSAAARLPKIRILIVDDHAVVRQGLRMFIDLQDDMQVVGEGENGAQAIDLAGRLHPDIVLLDLVMPEMDGVEATGGIKAASPETRVIILTSFGEDSKVFPAIRAGAQGYLLKDIRPDELVTALREAHQGKVQLHPDIARRLMSAVSGNPSPENNPEMEKPDAAQSELTGLERDILHLIAEGMNNRQIAHQMVISEKSVKTHISAILTKLGLEDRLQAARWAIKHESD